MIMPSVDYSPLYNAIDRRTGSIRAGRAAQGAHLRMQQVDLNRRKLIADTVFSSIDTAVQIGQAIYGMAEAADAERAKKHANEFNAEAEALRQEYVHNNKYAVEHMPDGSTVMTMDPEFDEQLGQLKQDYLEKHKFFPSVRRWLDTTMTGQENSHKAAAMGQFYSQEAQARNTLYADNVQDSVEQSIKHQDPSIFRAQIMSSKSWRPMTMREQDLYAAQEMYDRGIQQKELGAILKEKGLSGAYAQIDSMDVTQERRQELRNYVSALDNNNQISYGAQIQQVIQQAEQEEKTPHEIAEIIQNTGIPEAYKKPAVRAMELKGDMETVNSVVFTQGTDAAAKWIKAQDYTSDEETVALQQIGIARDRAVADYTNQYTGKVVENAKNGYAYEAAFNELEESNIPEEYKAEIKHDMTAQLSSVVDNTFLKQYNASRYNGQALLNLRDNVQHDVYARYGRIPKMQKEHLDLINTQLKKLGINPDGSGSGAGSNEEAAALMIERYRRGIRDGQISQYSALQDLKDPESPFYQTVMEGLGPEEYTELREEFTADILRGTEWQEYAKEADRNLQATLKDLEIPEEEKAGIAAYVNGEIARAIIYDRNITFDKLQEIRETAEMNAFGKVHDLMSAQYTHKDFTGTPTEKQLVAMQEVIDSEDADLSRDVSSGETIFPPGTEQGYNYLIAAQRTRLIEHLGDSTISMYFKADGPNDITSRPIYVQEGTGRQFTFHAKDGELVPFEIKDGEEIPIVQTEKEKRNAATWDSLTLTEAEKANLQRQREFLEEEKEKAGLSTPKRSQAAPITGRGSLQGFTW